MSDGATRRMVLDSSDGYHAVRSGAFMSAYPDPQFVQVAVASDNGFLDIIALDNYGCIWKRGTHNEWIWIGKHPKSADQKEG